MGASILRMFPAVMLGTTVLGWSADSPAGPTFEELTTLAKVWLQAAPVCRDEPGDTPFIAGHRNDQSEACTHGDGTIFSGLLCAAGHEPGCVAVKEAQSTDGGWWRSPRSAETGLVIDSASQFSRDQAMGVFFYLASEYDNESAARWERYIGARAMQCEVVVENEEKGEMPETTIFRHAFLRYCGSGESCGEAVDATLQACVPDPDSWECKKAPLVQPCFLLPTSYFLHRVVAEYLRLSELPFFDRYRRRDLIGNDPATNYSFALLATMLLRNADLEIGDEEMKQVINDIKNNDFGSVSAAALVMRTKQNVDFELHLAALEMWLLRDFLKVGDQPWPDAFEASTRNLIEREPENAFFVYLHLRDRIEAGDEEAIEHVATLVIRHCPGEAELPTFKHDWIWQRPMANEVGERSKLWDCFFMAKLLGAA